MNLPNALLGAGIIATGLMAGLWYGWTVSVIPGTRRVADANYVETMQHINRAIINPAFIIPFLGIPALLGAAALMQFRSGDARRGWLLAGAVGAYLLGVLGVTMGGNVPLNEALDTFDLAGSNDQAISARRHDYETPWNRRHYLRTAANAGAFALTTAAALVTETETG
ncbi:MAG: anthrone oxygenase family protein [Actinomycetota bacterium]